MKSKRPLKTLERVLSKAGLGSRVDARQWVRAGRVTVNGRVVRDPDRWIDMGRDRVRFNGRPLEACACVYLLLQVHGRGRRRDRRRTDPGEDWSDRYRIAALRYPFRATR